MTKATQIRPRCHLRRSFTADSFLRIIRSKLKTTPAIRGKVVNHYIYLTMPEDKMHYWSPELRIQVNEEGDETTIDGVAGPNGKVWGTFLVFYGLAVMLLIFGGSYGISMWLLNMGMVWLWSIPGSVLLYVLILLAAKYGQRLGADQLYTLRTFLDECIAEADAAGSFQFAPLETKPAS